MAHVAIVSAAYWGDVMPFVPVAEELARRGHRVTVAVPRGFHDVLAKGPFELRHLGTDFSPRELADHGTVLNRADSPLGMRAAAELWVRRLCIEPAEDILAVLDEVDPDVWFVHPSTYWLTEMAAARSATPIVVGHLFPMMIPSAEQPPPTLPVTGGRRVNRLGWRVGRSLAGRMMYDGEINRLRATRGLEPVAGNVGFGWQRARQTLLLSSEQYWPRPSDWPEQVVTTGFTVWDGSGAGLPEGLGAYLDAGPAPALVTFGTSAASNAGDAFEQAAAAVEACGHRALLLVGNDRNRAALADRDDVWTFAPLPKVLPRCRAVVHAGGHGSTAAALQAGIPQLALPMGFDQVGHAARIRQLGVGKSLPFRRRNPSRLTDALADVLHETCAAAASRLAQRLHQENGPATAADHLDAILADPQGHAMQSDLSRVPPGRRGRWTGRLQPNIRHRIRVLGIRPRAALPRVMPPPAVLRAAQAMRRGLERAHRGSTLPLVALLEQAVGLVEVHATTAFVELGLPDAMAGGPRPASTLAGDAGADADAVERLLAFLATRGIVRRRGDLWMLTPTGDLLRADHPDSVRGWVRFLGSDWHLRAWEHLADGIRTPSTTPFEFAHGTPYFDHLAREPAHGELFDDAMRSTSRLQGDLLARALDLDGVREVCDVGGGTGSILLRLLERHPDLRGRLVELPAVIDRAHAVVTQAGMADRVTLAPGNMLETIPAGPDRYLLSAVLHDWPNDDAVTILANVRAAMTAPGARAIVVELELPDHHGAALERAYDLLMLVLGGGRERTRQEFEHLYSQAGLHIDHDTVLANGWHAHHLAPRHPGRHVTSA